MEISIHAPPRGATLPLLHVSRHAVFQFTPLREGRPAPAPDNTQAQFISIHAPPRGATLSSGQARTNI